MQTIDFATLNAPPVSPAAEMYGPDRTRRDLYRARLTYKELEYSVELLAHWLVSTNGVVNPTDVAEILRGRQTLSGPEYEAFLELKKQDRPN